MTSLVAAGCIITVATAHSCRSHLREPVAVPAAASAVLGCLLRADTDVDSDVCKCRCRMSTGFHANVDGNVEDISIYHRKKAPKNQNHMLKKCRIICWYICIYIYTHTHTHPQKAHFQAFSREKVQKIRDWLQKMSMLIEKTCKCQTYVNVNGSSKCRPDIWILAPPWPGVSSCVF